MLVKNKLYGGKVNILFDSGRHKYTWEEERKEIKSVTKVLSVINKPALVNWASNMAVDTCSALIIPGKSYDEMELAKIWQDARKAHWQKKVDAGDKGTFLHKWVEQYIKGEKPGKPVNEELQESVLKFMLWVKKHKVEFLLSEQVVFSKKYQYTGTTDFICKINGKMFIGDLKTSSGIYPEYMIQTSAYRYAREEEFPKEKYAGQLIVRIGKDGSFEFAIMEGKEIYQRMFIAFVSALELSRSLDILGEYEPDKG